MGMSAIGLMKLLYLLSVCLVNSASILENSGDLLQHWLLHENDEPLSLSVPQTRRITPKSIFVVPAFRCPEGERLDQRSGSCVKMVQLDMAAKQEFWITKLNRLSASLGYNTPQRDSNGADDRLIKKGGEFSTDNPGPLQLLIPLAKNSSDSQSPEGSVSGESVIKDNISSTTISSIVTSTTEIISQSRRTETPETSSLDYVEETTLPDYTNTPPSGTDYADMDMDTNTEGSHDFNTESLQTDATVTEPTTDDPSTETTSNASQNCQDCDKEDSTESTTSIPAKPNYNAIISLHRSTTLNPNSEQFYPMKPPHNRPISLMTADSKPFGSVKGSQESESAIVAFEKQLPNADAMKPLVHYNILTKDAPKHSSSNKQSTFVRFPETLTKSTYIRFPVQKITEMDDTVYSESSPSYRYWNRPYPAAAWTSWKTKPQFIHIMPETSAGYPTDVNFIRTQPYFQSHTEWYKAK